MMTNRELALHTPEGLLERLESGQASFKKSRPDPDGVAGQKSQNIWKFHC